MMLERLTLALCACGQVATATVLSGQESEAPDVVFEQLTYVEVGELDRVRAFGGDGRAYVAGHPSPREWTIIDPIIGGSRIQSRRGVVERVDAATGSHRRQRQYVVHEHRLSILSTRGKHLGGRFLPGTVLAANTDTTGSARMVLLDERGLVFLSVPYSPDGQERGGAMVVANPFDSGEWLARIVAIGQDQVYVANGAEPYQIGRFGFDGRRLDMLEPKSPVLTDERDQYGRPRTWILAMHEIGSVLLVVVARLRDDAPGLYGDSFRAFEEQNDFFVDVLRVSDGQLLASSPWGRPPFYGGIDQKVVYRIDEGPDGHSRTLVFFKPVLTKEDLND